MFSKKLKLMLAAGLVVFGGITGIAAAKGPHAGGRAAMKAKFDLNKDGTIDDAERAKMKAAFQARHAERKAAMLAKFDGNKNGALDPAEKQAMFDQRATARFEKLDANGDGAVTLDEFKAGKQHGKRHGRRGMKRGRL